MTNNETENTMTTIENTITQLEDNIDQLTRRLEQLQDISRAAQYLVDAIHVSNMGDTQSTGGIFGDAYNNIRQALKAYYQPNGSAQ